MKIVFFEIEEKEKSYIEKKLSGHELIFTHEHLTNENIHLAKDAEILSVFIYSELTKEILQKFPHLKLITTRSTGYDHIDSAYCKEKNIVVSNVPEYGSHSVAEHTIALILAITRKIVPSVEQTRKGNFDLTGMEGIDLNGKTLGIVGLGNIGMRVATVAKAFGMKVLVSTRHPDEKIAHDLGITFVELPLLLESSDIVTLHVPHTKETEHMINKETISTMKKGSILINTARGGLIETEALVHALDTGILRGAGIDVLEEECDIREEKQLLNEKFLKECDMKTQLLNHVLLNRENVLVTPHNAFNSKESLHTILHVTVHTILDFLEGKTENAIKN